MTSPIQTVAEMVPAMAQRLTDAGAHDLAARLLSPTHPLPTIPVYHRQRYGALDSWPANPEQARQLFTLTGNRTLSAAHRAALEAMGFTFVTVPDPAPPRVR